MGDVDCKGGCRRWNLVQINLRYSHLHAVVQHVKGKSGIISVETLREIVSGNLLCIVLERCFTQTDTTSCLCTFGMKRVLTTSPLPNCSRAELCSFCHNLWYASPEDHKLTPESRSTSVDIHARSPL